MAKRGQFFPYRILFQYPDRKQYTDVIKSQDELISKTKFFLLRGASVKLVSVDPDGSRRQFAQFTPGDIPDETLEAWRAEGYARI
jgi:hypothetical protein